MGDWRGEEGRLSLLMGKFYQQGQYTDVTFHLKDGSTVEAHKLILAVSNSVMEALFYGPMAESGKTDFTITAEPVAFRRFLSCIYNSSVPAWDIEDPHEFWDLLEVADMYICKFVREFCLENLDR